MADAPVRKRPFKFSDETPLLEAWVEDPRPYVNLSTTQLEQPSEWDSRPRRSAGLDAVDGSGDD
jgi:hypothetical protein